jgi:hypothetical protein
MLFNSRIDKLLRCYFSKSDSDAQQTTEQQQVGAEVGSGSGAGALASGVAVLGANAQETNAASGGGSIRGINIGSTFDTLNQSSAGNLSSSTSSTAAKKGGSSVINITSNDPAIAEASLEAGAFDTAASLEATATGMATAESLAGMALASNTEVSQASIAAAGAAATGSQEVAAAAIGASADANYQASQLSIQALQNAEAGEAGNTTAVENEEAQLSAALAQNAANIATIGNNTLTGNNQPVSQAALPTDQQETGLSWSNVAVYISIAAGLIAIVTWLLRKGKTA